MSLAPEIEIIPTTPKPGDQIDIKIKGALKERVPIELNYFETVPVVGNTFVVGINKIQVPWLKNRLIIEALSVATMNLGVKYIFWRGEEDAIQITGIH